MIDGKKVEGYVRGRRGETELELNPDLDASVKRKKEERPVFTYLAREFFKH